MGAYEIRNALSLDQLKLQLIIIKMKLKKTSQAIIRILIILVSSTNATANITRRYNDVSKKNIYLYSILFLSLPLSIICFRSITSCVTFTATDFEVSKVSLVDPDSITYHIYMLIEPEHLYYIIIYRNT